jgi:tRNA(Met) cytidine acetyltransferase
MELAARLRAEAQRAGERRLLVLTGDPSATRDAARDALEAGAVAPDETTVVGPADFLDCEHLETVHARELLGRTRTAVVMDCHEACRPNALGAAVGAVDGGGLLLVLAPPLDEWPERRDDFDDRLAAPPATVDDVAGHFRSRLVSTLRAHPGIAIVDADSGTVERTGLIDPAPRFSTGPPAIPEEHAFPRATYEACLTGDQVETVRAFESLAEPGTALVVEADRGRGKSSAAGLAAGALAHAANDVLVTAPQYRSASEVFARAGELLSELDTLRCSDDPENPHELRTDAGLVRYEEPTDAARAATDADVVIVDEAAALPVRVLERFLDAPSVAFTTTVHGYEGAGRGFSVRFRERLAETDYEVVEREMLEPIRYASGDPVESWVFRALMLDARPAVEQVVTGATTASVDYECPDSEQLLADEHLLREVFGLLVLAHYRTEPDDLARLLDAPNVTVRALTHDGHVVSVALLAREGGLPAALRAEMYEGGRVRGNMIPDVLTTQLRDEAAGVPVGQRVLRIATHPAVRSRGLGAELLDGIAEEFEDRVDWLGVGYGATPELVDFWAESGYRTVHCSTTRNDRSGEYSAIMLQPCSADGLALTARHTEWFLDRIESVLSDPLDDLDPDVARAILRAVDGTPALDLSDPERRLVAGIPGGAGVFDTAPAPVRRLALRHLVDPAAVDALTEDQERLLVRKALQGHPWDAVADEMDFVSTAECMRALGRTVERLVRLYGDDALTEELDRHT